MRRGVSPVLKLYLITLASSLVAALIATPLSILLAKRFGILDPRFT